ncbi:MAG TPA: dihydroneopterin aldolase [Bacteroidales bacterium]|nr:MAG: dihydroneopterin aldolase [Bacteroidetes bacterium GWE2_42_24]OFY27769.1 MAG: dihydroneopterin aldolase [Bacteroidetes bacterium GWF2_43_11]PKP16790.1 MAG: dihydroneopterin aldolase [Bacteroidetes bacterium HGW-Bacteroidetes-22]HAQ64906.1 dihydroneopterin aldolase [Bacteroidales bacterium]HBZ66128.1 dihydroneopterin aldolase [Bacteroidales bacterium]
MSVISLQGMEFYAYHGCFDAEQVIGTHFTVDLMIETDVRKAAVSDDLHHTVNYLTVYQLVKAQMDQKSHLLEHVARRILHELMFQFEAINYAEVKVAKMNPPLGGKLTSVSVTMTTEELNSDG